MKLPKLVFIVPAILLSLSGLSFAALNFPYANLRTNLPIYEEPLIGMGNYYTGLAKGTATALWNPAGIMKVQTVEANASVPFSFSNASWNKSFKMSDFDFNAGSGINTGVYFTNDMSDLTKKDRDFLGSIDYAADKQPLAFDQSIRINDMFAFGVKTVKAVSVGWDMIGSAPMTAQYVTDFKGINNYNNSGVSIDNTGKITYNFSGLYEYKSASPLWNGFLTQNMRLPTTVNASMQNSFSMKDTIVLNGGMRTGAFSWGLNIIPISVQAAFDNNVQSTVTKGSPDMYFYTPNFDPNNEKTVADWTSDQNLYGTQYGYKANPINVPAGEVVMDSKWSGTYTGSAIRTDLGMTWDIQPGTNLNLVMENFLGSSLNMRGAGISYYANSRFNQANPNIDPAKGTDWTPFTSSSKDFTFGDNGLFLEPEKTYQIPKRIRIGASIAKPFPIAIDIENQVNPLPIRIIDSTGTAKMVDITNLNVLRLGTEFQLFRLPLWFSGGMGFVYKPSCENKEVQDKIDSIFKIGSRQMPVFPAKLDLGLQTEISGIRTGLALGVDALSVINMYQVDFLYSNIGKTVYYSLYGKKDPWQVSYTAAVDPIATVAGVQGRGVSMSSLTASDLKWNQIVSVSYKF